MSAAVSATCSLTFLGDAELAGIGVSIPTHYADRLGENLHLRPNLSSRGIVSTFHQGNVSSCLLFDIPNSNCYERWLLGNHPPIAPPMKL